MTIEFSATACCTVRMTQKSSRNGRSYSKDQYVNLSPTIQFALCLTHLAGHPTGHLYVLIVLEKRLMESPPLSHIRNHTYELYDRSAISVIRCSLRACIIAIYSNCGLRPFNVTGRRQL